MEDIISQAHAIGHYIFISTDSVFMACDRVRVLAYQVLNKMRHKQNAAQTFVSQCAFLGTFSLPPPDVRSVCLSTKSNAYALFVLKCLCLCIHENTNTQGAGWVAGASCHPTTI